MGRLDGPVVAGASAAGGPAGTAPVRGPVVGLVRDLLFASRIRETARQLGLGFRAVRTPAELEAALAEGPGLVLVDLTARDLDLPSAFAVIEAAGRPAPVVGWTTHVLAPVTKPLHARCDRVLTKEALTAELPDLLRDGPAPGRPTDTPSRHGAGDMDSEAFVRDLDERNQAHLRRLAPEATLKPEVEGDLSVVNLLKVALKNELEATETAARWLVTTPELDVKLALARQVGDEARHYRLIVERLDALGFDARGVDPLAKGYGLLFQYLDTLRTTVERVAAGQFTREAIAIVKNRQFIELCEAVGDLATAKLYREIIEPDERHHHELGRRLLLRYATTPGAQEAARQAASRTLELAEELQSVALHTAGIHHAPGC